MNLAQRSRGVCSRADFVAFVTELRADLLENGQRWENADLSSFLESMAAWVEDLDGYWAHNGGDPEAQPGWRTLAEVLSAARDYE